MKIIFCGFGRAAKECLLQLLADGTFDKQLLVYTHQGHRNEEFIELLNNLGIEYSTESINDNLNKVKVFSPDYLISVYYRILIKNVMLEMVDFKTMNLHPSLLPDYKGCFSSVWAILNGESETGISFHYITDQLDSGNIILQKKLKIGEDDTAYSLYHKLTSMFVQDFNLAFKRLRNNVHGIKQDKNKESRCYKREVPFGGTLDSKTISYDYAKRFVRAMYFPPMPGAKFIIEGKEIEIKNPGELGKYKDKFVDSK